MNLHRLSVKFFLAAPAAVDLHALTPVFHRWIQQAKLPGMLIDVADYRHMVDGPGVVLIGHDVDYALDLGGGRPGLLHTRKRGLSGSLKHRLHTLFHDALTACHTLEGETGLPDSLRFATDEAELTLLDRLRAPNDEPTFAQLRGEIEDLLAHLHDGGEVHVQRDASDSRRCLSIRIHAPGAADLKTLIDRLSAVSPVAE